MSVVPTPSSLTVAKAAADSTAHTTYQLWVRLARPVRVVVGRFAVFDFPAGDYSYTGSARRNLAARLRRHCSSDKRLRWHIDYLLAADGAEVLASRTTAESECQFNARQAGQVLLPGFGSSDCQAGCGSHLKYRGKDCPPW